MVIADQVAITTDTDSEDEPDEGSSGITARKIRASDSPYHAAIMQKLHEYPDDIRDFANQRLSIRDRGEITNILNNRSEYVPEIAKKYGVTERKVHMALDVLALIRKV